jgi:hypothetical protein
MVAILVMNLVGKECVKGKRLCFQELAPEFLISNTVIRKGKFIHVLLLIEHNAMTA